MNLLIGRVISKSELASVMARLAWSAEASGTGRRVRLPWLSRSSRVTWSNTKMSTTTSSARSRLCIRCSIRASSGSSAWDKEASLCDTRSRTCSSFSSRSPTIVCPARLHGVVLSQPMMMVTELAPLGSLLDQLHKQCGRTSIHSLWQYSTQVSTVSTPLLPSRSDGSCLRMCVPIGLSSMRCGHGQSYLSNYDHGEAQSCEWNVQGQLSNLKWADWFWLDLTDVDID